MDPEPIWVRCLHLPAGTCPTLALEVSQLTAQGSPRPELNQDLALWRLTEACKSCRLAPSIDHV